MDELVSSQAVTSVIPRANPARRHPTKGIGFEKKDNRFLQETICPDVPNCWSSLLLSWGISSQHSRNG